ncbi:DNA-binding response regulator [Subtercola boreus]|uniref:DNA-binding response regulator n=2 Tax=Subtercola boreus TaxID=120213 RepID=A0A3E0VP19_9MICO|nr:DNA-binding response regulator [Subtercola boreus]TQL54007.1 LuxR family two component transcriptional regulator [Subtercola boreus]
MQDGGAGERTTVLVVDDHPLVRGGLGTLISSTADLTVVAEAGSGADAVRLAAELRPDVILMDLSMPGLDGVEATRRIVQQQPGAHIVVLTSFHDRVKVREALGAGAIGYLLKDAEADVLLAAIRSAALGHSPLDPRVAGALLPTEALPTGTAGTTGTSPLSAREADVLRLITRGLSNRQIGHELGIAERTVKAHVGSIFRHLGVADRTSAAMWARDHGF